MVLARTIPWRLNLFTAGVIVAGNGLFFMVLPLWLLPHDGAWA